MDSESERQQPEVLPRGEALDTASDQDVLQVAKGGGLVVVGEATSRFIHYLFSFVVARALGAEAFGLFTLGLATVSILSAIATLGLNQGVVRYGAIYTRGGGEAKLQDLVLKSWRLALTASAVLWLALVALAPWLSSRIFDDPSLGPVLALLSLSLPLIASRSVLLAATQAFKVTWVFTLVEKLFVPLCTLLLTVMLLAFSLALPGVIIAQLVTGLLAAFLAFLLMQRLFQGFPRRREPSVPTGPLLKFSVPLALVNLVQYSYERTETIILGIASTVASVGVYNVALRTSNFEVVLVSSLSVIFSPFISDLYERKAMRELENLYKVTAKWSLAGALPIFMLFLLFAQPIMGLFGDDFGEGALALVILGAGQLVNASMGQAGYVLVMTGRSGLVLINTMTLLVVSLILDVLLIPPLGLLGAALAAFLAISSFSILRAIEVYWLLNMHPLSHTTWKPVVASLVAALTVYALKVALFREVNMLSMLTLSVLYLALFVLLIYRLGLDREDQLVVTAIRRKMRGLLRGPAKAISKSAAKDFRTR